MNHQHNEEPNTTTTYKSRLPANLPTPKPAKKDVIADRYKVKMCSHTILGEPCPYGIKCMFAHSEEELRSKEMNICDGLTTPEDIRNHQRMLRGLPPKFNHPTTADCDYHHHATHAASEQHTTLSPSSAVSSSSKSGGHGHGFAPSPFILSGASLSSSSSASAPPPSYELTVGHGPSRRRLPAGYHHHDNNWNAHYDYDNNDHQWNNGGQYGPSPSAPSSSLATPPTLVTRRWRRNPYSTSHPVEEVVQTSFPSTSGVATKKSLASKNERQTMMKQLGMMTMMPSLSSASDSDDQQEIHEEEETHSQMSGDVVCVHSDEGGDIYLADE